MFSVFLWGCKVGDIREISIFFVKPFCVKVSVNAGDPPVIESLLEGLFYLSYNV